MKLPFIATILGALALVHAAPVPEQSDPSPKYIVTYKEGTNIQAHTAWVSEVHASNIAKRSLGAREFAGVEKVFRVVPAYVGQFDELTLEAIKASPDVLLVEEDSIAQITGFENEAHSEPDKRTLVLQNGATYGLGSISHRGIGSKQYVYDSSAGEGTYGYVVDTGIRTSHVEFGGRAVAGYNALNSGTNTDDDNGHGTHVAGTMGSSTYGVSKKANLIAVKVLNAAGRGTWSTIIDGIDWSLRDIITNRRQNRAVINLSLGGSFIQSANNAVQAAYTRG